MKPERSSRVARFYLAESLVSDSELTLTKTASHHLITVLRGKFRDELVLFNGDGYNYRASIVDTGQRTPGKQALLTVHERSEALTESDVAVTLVQAISRGDRMDMTLRQSVELGVQHIQPLNTRYSAKPLDPKRQAKKHEHWQNIIISACEQSGRAVLPSLALPLSLDEWLSQRDTKARTHQDQLSVDLMLSPLADYSMTARLLQYKPAPEALGLIIGPESGFDSDEIARATAAGVTSVKIGPRILRTETAGPACLTLVQSILGDMGSEQA